MLKVKVIEMWCNYSLVIIFVVTKLSFHGWRKPHFDMTNYYITENQIVIYGGPIIALLWPDSVNILRYSPFYRYQVCQIDLGFKKLNRSSSVSIFSMIYGL